jgi:exosortase
VRRGEFDATWSGSAAKTLTILMQRQWNRKHVAFLACLALSVGIWWHPLTTTWQLATSNDGYTYILLIVPLSLSLTYLEGKNIAPVLGGNRWIGTMLLGIALLLRIGIAWNPRQLTASEGLSASIFSLVLWWIGIVIACCGMEILRSHLFPLCFLFLIVPLPERALHWTTVFLQRQSAWSTSALFQLIGLPVTRDGVVLSIPGLTIQIEQECSSIRSSTMLVIVALILAYLFLKAPWRRIVLVLATIPTSIAKNAIRIFIIAELGTRVNPSFLHGALHRHGGIVFLSLAVLVIAWLLWLLRRGEVQPAPAGPRGLSQLRSSDEAL